MPMLINLAVSFSFFFLLFAGNFSCSKSDTMKNNKPAGDGGFAIYFYNHNETAKFETHIYNYDSSWMNFLNNAPLSDVIISDAEIDSYDWEKQQVRLTPSGKDIFTAYLAKWENEKSGYRFSEKLFIVTLNGKRIYAGRIELRFSQMAIKYPIMSYGENGDNYPKNFDEKPILWLIPFLLQPVQGDPNEDGKLTVKNEEIYKYFKSIDKLK